ncbi:MAG: hypothetical protein GXP53_06440 [Deltaproteobacteria bacterium]|nr:hypothetical protein [Deltaproteobacteria bacterium]
MVIKRKLILPNDAEFKASLEKKLKEYKKRVKMLKKSKKFSNPDMAYSTIAGYKALIAQRLAWRGEVDTQRFGEELKEEYGFIDFIAFNTAAAVIDDYCRTGGKNVIKAEELPRELDPLRKDSPARRSR